jgi:hypothetical protein
MEEEGNHLSRLLEQIAVAVAREDWSRQHARRGDRAKVERVERRRGVDDAQR